MKNKIFIIAGIAILFWVIELINTATGHSLRVFGILPRNLVGLRGLIFSPFLHGNIFHLMCNTIPFVVLGSLVSMRGIDDFFEISLIIMIVGGGAVWLFGRQAYHIGASGLIFGYFGFLVAAGWFERKIMSLIIALIVLFLYGGMIWGVLPLRPFVSWEGHLFSLLAGIICARILKPKK